MRISVYFYRKLKKIYDIVAIPYQPENPIGNHEDSPTMLTCVFPVMRENTFLKPTQNINLKKKKNTQVV